jgi:heme exporter protein B
MPVTSLDRFLLGQFQRQLKLAFSRPGEILNPIWFFMMVVALFPLGMGPRPEQLAPLAPGILWVVALLSQLTVSHRLFASDYEDGSLEQLVLSDHPLALSALAQVLAHWVVSGVTLALLSPLFAVVLALPSEAITTLVASLLIGTLGLSLIGAIGAALTVGIRRGALLLSLLIIPLYVPVLIFGTSAVVEASRGDDGSAWLALMGAWAIASLILAPPAISAGLKISLDA